MHPRASGGPAARLGWAHAPAAIALALLAACGSTPRPGGPSGAPEPRPGAVDSQRDGPPADPPPDLISRPDPEPRVEPVRSGGPNKPYEVLGQRYTPLGPDAPVVESGLGSWYGRKFHGRPTASGELYDMYASSAAHRTMPIPSYALVRNPANGREVVVRVNDRGPFHPDRIIDLSYAAALKLGILLGVTRVEVRRLTHEEIRTGRWRGDSNWARADTATPARPSPIPEAGAALPATPAATVATAAATTAPAATPAVPPAGATPSPSAGYWVQLGAFRQRQTANELRDRLARDLAWLEPWLAIFDDRTLFRLQAGPFATRSEAQGTADRIRSTAPLQPMVLQRR
jgi:rare lipoprotein A